MITLRLGVELGFVRDHKLTRKPLEAFAAKWHAQYALLWAGVFLSYLQVNLMDFGIISGAQCVSTICVQ